jgi:trk system potassium uptake protein TrkH
VSGASPRSATPVLRRRRRETRVIDLPKPPPRPDIPHPHGHAKTFVIALLVLMLAGALVLATPWATEDGTTTPPVDALFTAVSAAAVTGLVTVDTQSHWNFFGEAVILVLIQAGGLGFMVGASLVLQTLRRGQTRLADALLVYHGAPTFSLREAGRLSRRIVWFTLATEGIGAVLLALRFRQDMPLAEALWHGTFHSVSAFCNAGFDLQGGYLSMAPYRTSIWVNVVMMLLIQAGALSYIALEDVATARRWRRLAIDTKLVLVLNLILLVGGALVFLAAEWDRSLAAAGPGLRPMVALFQSVSARTAGFASVDYSTLHVVTLFAWIALMLVGGASGSTAGGVKLTTVGVIAAAVVSTLRGRTETSVFGRRIETPLVFRAMAVVVLMVLAHFAVTLALATTEDFFGQSEASFISLMFEAMSALATVGLSTGITPSLTTAGKLVLCAAMFFGRLGPLTAAYAIQRRQQPLRYRLPAAPVRIG